jgi:dTDP-4-amino-4,6-dideoxygalactose transaminase
MDIRMMDLQRQYKRLKKEIDTAVSEVIAGAAYINGPQVDTFCSHLAAYLNVPHVIPCGNGTDAILLALRALDLQPGDEILLPAYTGIAAIEMVALLGLTPVVIDVNPETFNLNTELPERTISRRIRAIIAVHLFGQACDMEPVMSIATKYKLAVIEDNAHSLGADCTFSDGAVKKAGTVAHIGTTSFAPDRPLACLGDGGALFTSDDALATRIRMLANYGQAEKYRHQIAGYNSRLDTIQAAILNVNLTRMDRLTAARQEIALRYDRELASVEGLKIPEKATCSTHIYHRYTLQVANGQRDALQAHLKACGISSEVYCPRPVHEQEAYKWIARVGSDVSVAARLSREALSLPVHPELTPEEQQYIIQSVKQFFRK